MTDTERSALSEVRREREASERALAETIRRRPNEMDVALALGRLETTYLLRAYATFEGLLRSRLGAATPTDAGLTNLVQQIAGEDEGFDPATQAMDAWWKLLRRDRNPLMHGRHAPPAWDLNITIRQFETFLTQIP